MQQAQMYAGYRLSLAMAFALSLSAAMPANARSPNDVSTVSRGANQAQPDADQDAQQTIDDPYMQLMQRFDPYSADGGGPGASHMPPTAAANDAGGALSSARGASRTLDQRPPIARVLNNSLEPGEIIGSGIYQSFAASTGVQIVNTIDPLAMAAATVILRAQGLNASTEPALSPFVAGQCLYYMQDLTIQGLPSACR
ncbi:hypothetical protein [Paraburkholderia sp.]|jgi:hypothetical protein|uniref:hypothetical protein n=1 Tax=Paraburkholderia sp. TaxID=1926495 RepID=UPI003C631D5A